MCTLCITDECRLLTVCVGCCSLLLVVGFHLVGCRVSVVDCRCWLSFAVVDCWLPCVGCQVTVFTVDVDCRSLLLVAGCHLKVVRYELLIVGVACR